MKTPRPYQHAALDAIRDAIRQGKRRIMLQIPTGGGKTVTAATMLAGALAKEHRSLFVAHRLELINQTVRTFADIGITSIGVIRAGDKRRDPSQPIQVASIQTLVRRKAPPARIVFVDEAHRSCAKSYERAIFQAYPDALIVGLSATPCRADGKPLGAIYEHLIHGATYAQLIADGYIIEPEVYGTPVLPDLAAVHTSGGDYDQEELEAAVNRRALIGNIVTEWQRRAEGLRTVVFAVGVAHSKAIVEQFTEAGVRAEHLDGTTPEPERLAILDRLRTGDTTLVSNVGVLCEGWDMPACKCLVLARPTKSLVLFMQMAGRILRPWCAVCQDRCDLHSSVRPIILDHAGNVDRHGMPHEDREWSLSDKPKRCGTAPVKACKECFAMIAASLGACPHCGYEFPAPAPPPPPEPELTAVELALRTLTGEDAQLRFFRDMTRKARDRRWKPGAVLNRFRDRFGFDAPNEWRIAFWLGFKRDAEWRDAVAARGQESHAV